MNIFLVMLIIGMLIFVHELGHFLAARLTGIPIERFSIGFGPKIVARRSGATEFRLSLIPLGGYVLPAVTDENEFFRYPALKRIVFSLGGPAGNIILAVILFSVLNGIQGGPSFKGLMLDPFIQTAKLFGAFILSIPSLFAQPENLSGLVGIVSQGSDFIGGDIARALHFSIVISLNLAIFNLLPIPALDGGKILLAVLERIHPRMLKIHIPISVASWVFIIALMIYATVLDIGRLI